MDMHGMDHTMGNMHIVNNNSLYRFPMPAPPGQPLSEFNHHLAGLAVLIVGIAGLLMFASPRRFGWIKYVWPMSLLLLGVYLILYSDPPQWPSGYMSLSQSLTDSETLQHKVFAILLVFMGLFELSISAGITRAKAWRYVFPCLALFGAIFLLFHRHGEMSSMHDMPGMPGMDMVSHKFVFYQHVIYFILGVGVAVTLVLQNARKLGERWGGYIWPSFAVLFGVALMLYME